METDELETSERLEEVEETEIAPAVAVAAPSPVQKEAPAATASTTSSGAVAAAASTTAPPAAAAATSTAAAVPVPPRKKPKKKKRDPKDASGKEGDEQPRKKPRKKQRSATADPQVTAQQAINDQMRRVLEQDRFSAAGSIVEDQESDAEDYQYRGQPIRLDRTALQQAMKKYMAREQRIFRLEEETVSATKEAAVAPLSEPRSKKKKKLEESSIVVSSAVASPSHRADLDPLMDDDVDLDRDGGSIFGQTTGSSNSTWVECDKCKKWRRLRGMVDEKKLPKQWFCSMNKSDPERARCSAPEEEYNDAVQTQSPESLADMKARKHLRVWVRRLQCNEAYEARQPTLTRGKKKATTSSAKDPYEWIRCCNQACGKWRAILRIMDAKGSVMDRAKDGEWYCVMNTWDEKMASCAAPQENLPAIGCPPWVMQDE